MVTRRATAPKGLDNHHATAATGAGMLWCLRFVGIGAGDFDGFNREHWHCEQLASSRDVLGTLAAGEQAVVADAVEA
jgi:hypothetical protein